MDVVDDGLDVLLGQGGFVASRQCGGVPHRHVVEVEHGVGGGGRRGDDPELRGVVAAVGHIHSGRQLHPCALGDRGHEGFGVHVDRGEHIVGVGEGAADAQRAGGARIGVQCQDSGLDEVLLAVFDLIGVDLRCGVHDEPAGGVGLLCPGPRHQPAVMLGGGVAVGLHRVVGEPGDQTAQAERRVDHRVGAGFGLHVGDEVGQLGLGQRLVGLGVLADGHVVDPPGVAPGRLGGGDDPELGGVIAGGDGEGGVDLVPLAPQHVRSVEGEFGVDGVVVQFAGRVGEGAADADCARGPVRGGGV